jgi:hypothetical protein
MSLAGAPTVLKSSELPVESNSDVGVLSLAIPVSAAGGDTLVTVGSPPTPFSQNKQNEPAVAVDANHPNILASGVNDEIDLEACNAGDPTTCPFTPGVGVSGVYFSFNSGASWTQPTYSGWTARDCLGPASCTPHVGPIGTLPKYFENGLVSGGDPGLAFGPRPDASGHFSWSNGSRLYYSNLASNFPGAQAFMGFEATVVSRTDTDGGTTWTQKQVTPASNNPFNTKQGFGRSGCTVRTDSHGVVYVFANQFAVGMPGQGSHIMIKSFDGGKSWTQPVNIGLAVNTCFLLQFDGSVFRCVMDGVGGARDDLSAAPSVDIANGAPTGAGATNEILRTWVDGRDGVNHEHVFVSYSTNGGNTWSAPSATETAGDRGYYSAIAISPQGTNAYLVYNAFTTPLRTDTTSPRTLVGVVKHATIGGNGAPGAWGELHRSTPGDPRASSQNNLFLEFLGDYVYAAATSTYGVAVWNDVRNAADCPAIDTWRAAAQSNPATPKPAPEQACPATFGNSDILGESFPAPTP